MRPEYVYWPRPLDPWPWPRPRLRPRSHSVVLDLKVVALTSDFRQTVLLAIPGPGNMFNSAHRKQAMIVAYLLLSALTTQSKSLSLSSFDLVKLVSILASSVWPPGTSPEASVVKMSGEN